MLRWLKNRKEKKHKRRQEKHRRILETLKSQNSADTGSDYGFYRDEFMLNCQIENKLHDYEEIDDMSELSPQFSRIVGMDFRFSNIPERPPQLPARTFSTGTRSVSVSACKDVSNGEKFRERTTSLPCFEKRKHKFPIGMPADDEPFYNEPWDCKSNMTVKCDRKDKHESTVETVHLRIYEKESTLEKINFDSKWSNSIESRIYSEIEDSDTGCESDAVSQSGSDCSVFINDNKENSGQPSLQELANSLSSLNTEVEEASDSDASSGFCDGPIDVDEEHRRYLLKSLRGPQNTISSPSLFRSSPHRFHTFPKSPCVKIDEDAELYLIPKRRFSLKETKSEKLDLPIQKKRYQMDQKKTSHKSRNRLLDDLIWRNNFKQQSAVL